MPDTACTVLTAVLAAAALGVLAVLVERRTVGPGRVGVATARRREFAALGAPLLNAADAGQACIALRALEAAANTDPTAVQPVVDLLCAFLRRPVLPVAQDGTPDPRGLAVHLLATHLRPAATAPWHDVHLDLRGAELDDLDLSGTQFRSAIFTGARFSGTTRFSGARCTARLHVSGATFAGPVTFDAVEVGGPARFDRTCFADTVSFTGSTFRGRVDFAGAQLTTADFRDAVVVGDLAFSDSAHGPAQIHAAAVFDGACFHHASFAGVRWPAATSFRRALFAHPPHHGPTEQTSGVAPSSPPGRR